TNQPSDLRREQELSSRTAGQRLAEAAFAQAEAVVGSSVEVAEALIPGLGDGRDGGLVMNASVDVADRRTAEAEASLVVQSADDSVLDGHGCLLTPSNSMAAPPAAGASSSAVSRSRNSGIDAATQPDASRPWASVETGWSVPSIVLCAPKTSRTSR